MPEEVARQKAIQEEQRRIIQEEMDSIVEGGAQGFKEGILGGGLFFIVGLAISCTPIVGALIGLPFILFALMAPFLFGILGLKLGAGKGSKRVIRGKCPYCSGKLSVTVAADCLGRFVGVDCPLCRQRFLTRNKVFLRVPHLPTIDTGTSR